MNRPRADSDGKEAPSAGRDIGVCGSGGADTRAGIIERREPIRLREATCVAPGRFLPAVSSTRIWIGVQQTEGRVRIREERRRRERGPDQG